MEGRRRRPPRRRRPGHGAPPSRPRPPPRRLPPPPFTPPPPRVRALAHLITRPADSPTRWCRGPDGDCRRRGRRELFMLCSRVSPLAAWRPPRPTQRRPSSARSGPSPDEACSRSGAATCCRSRGAGLPGAGRAGGRLGRATRVATRLPHRPRVPAAPRRTPCHGRPRHVRRRRRRRRPGAR
jgi:hypothetical protein